MRPRFQCLLLSLNAIFPSPMPSEFLLVLYVRSVVLSHVAWKQGTTCVIVSSHRPKRRKLNIASADIAIAWTAMLWFDTTIFVLTLARAWQMHRRMPGGVLETLVRDGSSLFLRAPTHHIYCEIYPAQGLFIMGSSF